MATIAGESRLAFDILDIQQIPYQLSPASGSVSSPSSILDWPPTRIGHITIHGPVYTGFQQRVAPTALPPGTATGPAIHEPTADRTAIESPYRLQISPSTYAFWNHSSDLVPGNPNNDVVPSLSDGSVYELWHTRLGVQNDGLTSDDNDPTDADLRTIRAVWASDVAGEFGPPPNAPPPFNPKNPAAPNPYRMSLDAQDRYSLVRLTSDFNAKGWDQKDYTPVAAVNVKRLALSTLGAWMDVRGAWQDQPAGIDVLEWTHRATMARDHYVKVVYAGYLFPFGHKATLIKVTERKFYRSSTSPEGPIVAYLFQHMYIQVREPIKTFYGSSDDGAPNPADYPSMAHWTDGKEGRSMPFKSVRMATLVTPDIEDPSTRSISLTPPSPNLYGVNLGAADAFWPIVGSKDFLWHLVGTDWDGNRIEFTAPLIYVSEDAALPPWGDATAGIGANMAAVNSNYKASGRNLIQMNGQKLALAPSDAGGADVAVAASTMTLIGLTPDQKTTANTVTVPLNPDQPQFFPAVQVADVEIPAIKHLLGSAGSGPRTYVALADPFLNSAFEASGNLGEVFLKITDSTGMTNSTLPLAFGTGDGGQVVTPGVVSPNLAIGGLSRSAGLVGVNPKGTESLVVRRDVTDQLGDFANAAFDPQKYFGGALDGANLFGVVPLTDLLGLIPDFTKDLNKIPGLKVTKTDSAIMVRYFWETDQIKPFWLTNAPNVEEAIFVPFVIGSDGSFQSQQAAPSPGASVLFDMPALGPPPIPDITNSADDSNGGADNSDPDPTHVWVATYLMASGPSTTVTAPVAAGTLKVASNAGFSANGGHFVSGGTVYSYSGVSAMTSLTGVATAGTGTLSKGDTIAVSGPRTTVATLPDNFVNPPNGETLPVTSNAGFEAAGGAFLSAGSAFTYGGVSGNSELTGVKGPATLSAGDTIVAAPVALIGTLGSGPDGFMNPPSNEDVPLDTTAGRPCWRIQLQRRVLHPRAATFSPTRV